MQYLLLIGLGGGLGAIARYWVNQLVIIQFGSSLLGTFLANISGSFILGVLLGLLSSHPTLSIEIRMFLAVGFLGSYTTFSTLSMATVYLLQKGDITIAAINLGASVLLGLVAAVAGLVIGRSM